MTPLLVGTAVLTAATTLLALIAILVLRLTGRRPRWRTLVWFTLVSVPIHLFGTAPAALGILVVHALVGTRSEERAYAGPVITPTGEWLVQARGEIAPGPSPLEISLRASDGVRVRAFSVPPRGDDPPRAVVVLAHGLFRGGLELEPVAAMFRDLDCHVVIVELRNHGGSGRATATFGRDERLDVLAAVEWVRSNAALRARPLVMFGVSLGSLAVVLAAAELEPPPAALVLDASLDDPWSTANRMLADGPRGRGRRAFPQPFRALVLFWIELAAGVDLRDVSAIDALADTGPVAAALVVGGGEDRRTPPEVVRAVANAIRVTTGDGAEVWIREGSGHGDVWRDAPDEYRERLRRLLAKLPGR